MNSQTNALKENLRSAFRVAILAEVINDSFPHSERPGIEDMEEYINCTLGDKPVPEKVGLKMSSKPTKEMLEDFCKELGLSCYCNPDNGDYIFRIEKFQKEN